MKLDLSEIPKGIALEPVSVGDIYQNQRGYYLLVVGISGCTAYYIKYDLSGEPCGAGQYGVHALDARRRLGRVDEMPNLHVVWDPSQ